MLEQIARVMFWLSVGEIAARSGLLPLPAPVTGLILLYAELAVRGKLPDDLGVLADRLLQFLGMLFVPAGVGVIAYLGQRFHDLNHIRLPRRAYMTKCG